MKGLPPHSSTGAYVNFMMADEGQERVRATCGDNYERLTRVKKRHDPDNLFRINQNIRPSEQPMPRGGWRDTLPSAADPYDADLIPGKPPARSNRLSSHEWRATCHL
ncbi:MAG TPA: BBE domain-containing protein [Thermomicrobiales bacterium]|nr:BBE domain-containing protein [Thermomicrobiales bacterium]